MYLIIWLLAVISIALGIFVSNFARNEGQVLPMIPMVVMPSIFFSGIIVPVEQLPEWAEWFSLTTPMYYANNAIQTVSEAFDLTLVIGLMVYGVVVMSLAVLTLREQN
jgi:ABC-2 type transport system permease protein